MNKIKRIIIPLLFLIVLVLLLLFPVKEQIFIENAKKNYDHIDRIIDEDTIVEEFKVNDNYDGFELKYGSFSKIYNDGEVVFEILDKTSDKTKTIKKRLDGLRDNYYVFIKYKIKKNHEYSLTIRNTSNNNITFYTLDDNNDDTKLTINGELDESDLEIRFKLYKNSYISLWYYLVALVIYLIYLVLSAGDKHEKN